MGEDFVPVMECKVLSVAEDVFRAKKPGETRPHHVPAVHGRCPRPGRLPVQQQAPRGGRRGTPWPGRAGRQAAAGRCGLIRRISNRANLCVQMYSGKISYRDETRAADGGIYSCDKVQLVFRLRMGTAQGVVGRTGGRPVAELRPLDELQIRDVPQPVSHTLRRGWGALLLAGRGHGCLRQKPPQ